MLSDLLISKVLINFLTKHKHPTLMTALNDKPFEIINTTPLTNRQLRGMCLAVVIPQTLPATQILYPNAV